MSYDVEKAAGNKCERCWSYSEYVGSSANVSFVRHLIHENAARVIIRRMRNIFPYLLRSKAQNRCDHSCHCAEYFIHRSLCGTSFNRFLAQYGADILRLWTASSDYHSDIRISKEILKQLSDTYKKIRNTARFILGNLCNGSGFDPDKDCVPSPY